MRVTPPLILLVLSTEDGTYTFYQRTMLILLSTEDSTYTFCLRTMLILLSTEDSTYTCYQRTHVIRNLRMGMIGNISEYGT